MDLLSTKQLNLQKKSISKYLSIWFKTTRTFRKSISGSNKKDFMTTYNVMKMRKKSYTAFWPQGSLSESSLLSSMKPETISKRICNSFNKSLDFKTWLIFKQRLLLSWANSENLLIFTSMPKWKSLKCWSSNSYKTLSITLHLQNISKSYYYYRTSLELYKDASRNPFAQPVQVFSNINNGFGIFAGAQVSYFVL